MKIKVDPDGDHASITLEQPLLLDIPEPDHYVGGVPPEFPLQHFTHDDHEIQFTGQICVYFKI